MLLSLGLVILAACSQASRHKTLKFFFDGVPDPADPAAGKTSEPPAPELPVVLQPVAPGRTPPAIPSDRSLTPLPALESVAPIETLGGWKAALAALPTDYAGGVDWVQAVDDGLITPRLLSPTGGPPALPFSLDTLARVASEQPDLPVLSLDIDLVPEQRPFFSVRFPHASHTTWLGCASCHPDAGSMRTEKMDSIFAGESCGKCHGKVAFEPEIACARCHERLAPGDESTVEAELSRAREVPLPSSGDLLARGQELYGTYCEFCHGEQGDGDGRLTPWLKTRPRDFTAGKYKFRTTIGTAPPTDTDLFRTITRGVPGTSMPAWQALPPEDRWALVHFIKTFTDRFDNEEPGEPITVPEPPEMTEELLATGREMYSQAGCNSCHGETGGGDGPAADSLVDDRGEPIRPFNFASGRPLKSGSTPADVYRVIMTGLAGTPMPGFGEVLPPETAWALTGYVGSLSGTARQPFAVRGDIPFDRKEFPPETEMEIRARAIEPPTAAELAEDELFLLAGKDIPPAMFPHGIHRIRFKCSSCHESIFKMKAGANPVTMTAMRRGEFCASCHDGNLAWQVAFTTCVQCHAER